MVRVQSITDLLMTKRDCENKKRDKHPYKNLSEEEYNKETRVL